jgi:pimeloyl-ACP methyl ester carboxylesterase
MSDGVAIHYRVEGDGPVLVLQHGFSGSAEDWFELGYVDRLKAVRRIVAVDARGHGQSGKPHDRAQYTPKHQARDVVGVLDDLGIEDADFFGYSMGGRIGFALAKYAPTRIRSYVIGGAAPYDLPPDTVAEMWNCLKRGAEGITEFVESQGPVPPGMTARTLANDTEALKAFFLSPTVSPDPLDDVLPTVVAPCLLIVGEDDFFYEGVRECARLMPKATLVTLPGLNHLQGFTRCDVAAPHVEAFLTSLDD